jgi:hypothetical protein
MSEGVGFMPGWPAGSDGFSSSDSGHVFLLQSEEVADVGGCAGGVGQRVWGLS